MNELRSTVIAAAERPAVAWAGTADAQVRLELYDSMAAIEPVWRAFAPAADCTLFQTFDYLSAWQRHVGEPAHVQPALVVFRRGGEVLAILPFAIDQRRLGRRLAWLGQKHSDYLGPLLARDFGKTIEPSAFARLWLEILAAMQRREPFRHDFVELRKMPEFIGAQTNPFLALPLVPNASAAHLMKLTGNWEEFYAQARSSATRRRDRTKLKRLGESGAVQFVTPSEVREIVRSFDMLMRQKSQALASMGVANLFAEPGVADFYRDLATGPRTRDTVHVSRLDVGETPAAINLGFQFRGRYYYIFASYDDGPLSRFGPGAAHLRHLLAYAIERELREFDFTIGDERYKSEWADTETKLYDYIVATTARGRPAAALTRSLSRIKRMIKQTPLLWEAFVRARAFAARLKRRERAN
jgi:CelD/BcsL family acetyltransferase involved in cellulose biosynthesis